MSYICTYILQCNLKIKKTEPELKEQNEFIFSNIIFIFVLILFLNYLYTRITGLCSATFLCSETSLVVPRLIHLCDEVAPV